MKSRGRAQSAWGERCSKWKMAGELMSSDAEESRRREEAGNREERTSGILKLRSKINVTSQYPLYSCNYSLNIALSNIFQRDVWCQSYSCGNILNSLLLLFIVSEYGNTAKMKRMRGGDKGRGRWRQILFWLYRPCEFLWVAESKRSLNRWREIVTQVWEHTQTWLELLK